MGPYTAVHARMRQPQTRQEHLHDAWHRHSMTFDDIQQPRITGRSKRDRPVIHASSFLMHVLSVIDAYAQQTQGTCAVLPPRMAG